MNTTPLLEIRKTPSEMFQKVNQIEIIHKDEGFVSMSSI